MRTEKEKMLAGEAYDAADPELVAGRARARALCRRLNAPDISTEESLRVRDELLGSVGESVEIVAPFFCDYGSNIHLGRRVFFNFNCVVLDVCEVSIGEFSQFGPGVQILTPLHPMNAAERRKTESGKPVSIGPDVWVGAGALILPGVTIGAGTVVGAGSVVTRSLPANVFAAGNPCRVLRALEP